MKELGQVAYEAYCKAVNNMSVTGVVLPKWSEQSDNLKIAWCHAAVAVERESIERENAQYRVDLDGDINKDDI